MFEAGQEAQPKREQDREDGDDGRDPDRDGWSMHLKRCEP
jgi:hypothetical protein